jgi:hypothetical protein
MEWTVIDWVEELRALDAVQAAETVLSALGTTRQRDVRTLAYALTAWAMLAKEEERRRPQWPFRCVCGTPPEMNRLLIVAILLISTAPLYAQRQQQNVAKLKADARNVVGIIGSDKTKTQTYCQIRDPSEQLIQAVEEKDRKKANALAEKIAELYQKIDPEFGALIDIEKACQPKFAGWQGNQPQ